MGKMKVYDIEQFANYHSAVFYNIETKEYAEFIIHASRNEIKEYLDYLNQSIKDKDGYIGYNNVGYDYPVIHFILENQQKLKNMTALQITQELYTEGQRIINEKFSSIPHWKTLIPQMDLYRIHHFNNMARATSLKHLQIAMRLDNVQDLPFPFDYWVKDEDVQPIQNYCKNDVFSTYKFFLESKDKINFRKRMNKQYHINTINFPDVKIGEEILIIENAKALGMDKKDFKALRTHRKNVPIKDIVLPYVSFKTSKFQEVLDYMNNQVITMDGKVSYSIVESGVKYDYGQGGIHGIAEKGIYHTDEEGELILVDVSSYYPNLAIENEFYPKHVSKKFCEVGKKLYQQRMNAKAEGDNEMVAAIKLALNGALFGKSNDIYSPMYDRKFFFSITINGQLLLSMLAEEIIGKGISIIQINTDGILVKCHKDKRNDLDLVCKKWMDLTNLKLDYDHFKLFAQRDVNNYLGLFNNGNIKYKGAFEIDKDWNKDHSMLIVPIALREYLINNTPIEKTIINHNDIFDFIKSQKVGKQYTVESHYLKDNKHQIDKLQQINRYYISNKGVKIYKRKTETDRLAELEVKYNVTIMNKFQKKSMKEYDINYHYYIRECQKIIDILEPSQLG